MRDVISTLQRHKHEFSNAEDLQPLLDSIGSKQIVMLGEASHGTHEYYKWRAIISKILLEKYGFDFVAVEGDWPACYEVNRHVKGYEDAIADPVQALREFTRWPTWMWANWEVHEWIGWLKGFNQVRPAEHRRGFYGLDVYSLWESMDAIMKYLEKEDPDALETAKQAMQCFEPHRDENGQRYALSTRLVPEGCSAEVTRMLSEIRDKVPTYNSDPECAFSTEQNALVSNNAERYYRMMASGGGSTWNLRDRHMMDTLNRLMEFHGDNAKGIVWAHNTHIGDADYTDMGDAGLYNLGELAREEYGPHRVSLVGLGGHKGEVLAGRDWGEAVESMDLPAARANSWEDVCSQAGRQFHIDCRHLNELDDLRDRIAHRAVGVVYDPRRERFGNYVPTEIALRYDHFLFFRQTQALHDINVDTETAKTPDTYPHGL
jgi:erythromycin esterase-like protein